MIAPVPTLLHRTSRPSELPHQDPVLLIACDTHDDRIAKGLEEVGFLNLLIVRDVDRLVSTLDTPPALVIVGCHGGVSTLGDSIRSLRSTYPDSALLFFADESCLRSCAVALEAGADDVLLPPHRAEGIGVRARLAWERRLEQDPPDTDTSAFPLEPLRVGQLTLDLTHREVTADDESVPLTGREFELLVRLIEAGGAPVSRKRLIRDIWGCGTTDGVLDATVSRLRRKLEGTSVNPNLLATVRGVGYRIAV